MRLETAKHEIGDLVVPVGHTINDLGIGTIVDISAARGYVVHWAGIDSDGDGWGDHDLEVSQ